MKKTFFILLAILLSVSQLPLPAGAVWQAPCSNNPPECNRPEPLDTSAQAQVKEGNLTVNGQLIIPSGATFTLQGTANFNALVNFNAGISVVNISNGDAVRGISSGAGNAGIYGQNTAGGWAGSFVGFLGAYNLTVGGPGQGVDGDYQSNGDIYAYNNVGVGGSLTVGGNVRGNFISQDGFACTNGQILKKNATNSWTCSADSGGVPGGATTQVQYNNAGAFAGDAGLTYNSATDALTLAGDLNIQGGGLTGANSESISIGETNDVVSFTSGGSEKMRISNLGVGIGTNSPNAALEVRKDVVFNPAIIRLTDVTNNPEFQLQYGNNASDHWGFYVNKTGGADNDFRIWSGSDRLTIMRSSGNVGIGTASPGYPLQVIDDNSVAIIDINNTGSLLWSGLRIARDGAEKWFVGIDNITDKLLFLRGGASNDVVIDTSGNVGIGTTNPSVKLHVKGNGPTDAILFLQAGEWNSSGDYADIRLGDSGGHYIRGEYNNGMTFYDNNQFRFKTGAADPILFLANGGNVGIGTPSPASRLHLSGSGQTTVNLQSTDAYGGPPSVSINAILTYNAGGSTTNMGKIVFAKNNADNGNTGAYTAFYKKPNGQVYSEAMRIDPDGNVGIGQTTPGAKLEVAGQIKITGGTPGANKVLTSDAAGLASWQPPSGGLWTNAGTYIYANNKGAASSFQINNADYGGVKIRNDNLQLDNYSLIYQSADAGSSPLLINDQLMVGRRYDDGCGHYCGNGADPGVDLANNENLIFGRVKANPTGNTNQNLLRLQQGNGADAQIDKFKVDLGGNVYADGNLGVVGSISNPLGQIVLIDDDVLVNGNYDIEGGLIVTGGITGAGGASAVSFPNGVNISGNFILNTASIDTAEIADNAITTDKIANLQVTAPKIADSTITFAKIASNGCSANQIMKYNGTAWACAADVGGAADNLGNHIATQAIQVNGGISGDTPLPQITFSNYYDNTNNPTISHINLYGSQYGFGISSNDLDVFSYQNIKFHSTDDSPQYDKVIINADTGDVTITGNLTLNTASIDTGEIAESAVTTAKISDGTVAEVDLDINNAPTSNYFLKWNSGVSKMEWAQVSASPGGANTQVQFNNNGAFAGDSGLTFNSGTDSLTVNGMFIGGSASLNLPAGQNLIYGNIDSASAGNLLLLQNESSDKFKVTGNGEVHLRNWIYDDDGDTVTIGDSLRVAGTLRNTADPAPLVVDDNLQVNGYLTLSGEITDSDSDVTINDGLNITGNVNIGGNLAIDSLNIFEAGSTVTGYRYTPSTYVGNLGGESGADAYCVQAFGAGWKFSTTNDVQQSQYLEVTPSKIKVHPVDNGCTAVVNEIAWRRGGGSNCNNWTSISQDVYGSVTWGYSCNPYTGGNQYRCSYPRHILCSYQPD